MATDVQTRAGKITVGPPDGPHVKIPAAYTITVTGEPPYDLRLDVTWDPSLGRHTLHELTITEQPDGVYVRMSQISQIALAESSSAASSATYSAAPTAGRNSSPSTPRTTPSPSTPSSTCFPTPSADRALRPRSPSPAVSPRPADRNEPPTPARPDSSRPPPNPAKHPG